MNATSMFWPSASSPMSVEAPSAMMSSAVDLVAALDDRALVDVRVLVRALVLDQVVDVDADLARHRLLVVDADDDAVGVDVVDHAAALGGDDGARVLRGDALDAGADERLLRAQRRHGLALHVRAHQRAVRVVVLEERHERGGDRDDLRRRDVHVLDALGRGQHRFAVVARRDQLVDRACLRRRASRSPGRSRTCLPRWPTGSRSGSSPCRRRRGGTASRGSRTR